MLFDQWGLQLARTAKELECQPCSQNCHRSGRRTGVFLRSPEQAERRSVPGYCLTAGKEMQCESQNTDS